MVGLSKFVVFWFKLKTKKKLINNYFLLRFEYLWADGIKFKKPTPLPAPKYVTHLMEWVESQINDESIFPVKTGN